MSWADEIPASVARELLGLVTVGLTVRIRRDGLRPSISAQQLLDALGRAADRPATSDLPAHEHDGAVDATLTAVNGITDSNEAARQFGCSASTIRRYARTGRLKASKIGGVWVINDRD